MTPRLLHAVAVTSLVGLIALMMCWIVWLAPPPASLRAPVLLALVTPLALLLRGVLHARRYTLAWSTLLIPFYLVHGIAYLPGAGITRALAATEIILSVAFFAGATLYLRRTRRQATAAA